MIDAYPEAVDAVDSTYEEFTENDINTLSDDWQIQFMSDASDICDAYGVPSEHRVDVVIEGMRQKHIRDMDVELQNFRWILETMRSF